MTIGIIAAMEEELVDLRKSLKKASHTNYHHFDFYTGMMEDHDVVLMQCGIGKVNAAVGTAILIDHYNPAYVINSGVAGGLYDTMHVGDIIVSTDVKHHDVDVTVFNYDFGQIPQMPSSYDASPKLIDIASQAFSAQKKSSHMFKGTIMSGDSFIHNDDQILSLKTKFPFVIAVEMEGAAIAQTCYLFSTPFVIIRSISDIVTAKDSQNDYDNFVHHASMISANLVRKSVGLI